MIAPFPLWILMIPFLLVFVLFLLVYLCPSTKENDKNSESNITDSEPQIKILASCNNDTSKEPTETSVKQDKFFGAAIICTLIGGLLIWGIIIAIVKMFPNHF